MRGRRWEPWRLPEFIEEFLVEKQVPFQFGRLGRRRRHAEAGPGDDHEGDDLPGLQR